MSERESEHLGTDAVTACRARLGRVGEVLQKQGLDALLVTNDKDIQYLTGFVGHDSLLEAGPGVHG